MGDKLKRAILAIPTREERCGGQTFKYVKLHEIMELLDAHAPTAPQVSVNGLVWEENPDKGECGLLAHSVIGTYHATCDGWSIHRTMRWEDADTIDAAKAAAQADYEARIVSAIDTTPVSVMRCAECDCQNGGADCNWIAGPLDDIKAALSEPAP